MEVANINTSPFLRVKEKDEGQDEGKTETKRNKERERENGWMHFESLKR